MRFMDKTILENKINISKTPRIGIMDVGGGMRDVYGAGVIDYLLDNHIYLPYSIGISAGAGNLASYVGRQRGRNLAYYEEYSGRPEYMSRKTLFRTGSYLDLDYVYGVLCNEGGEYPLDYTTMMRHPESEFVIAATDADTAKTVYFTKDDIERNNYWVLKSSSCIPIICRPVHHDGHSYYDGGIVTPVPYKKAFDDGCDILIIVLTLPVDLRLPLDKNRRFFPLLKKKYPNMLPALMTRHNQYNGAIEHLLANEIPAGKVFFIAPDDTCGMNTLTSDPKKMHELYLKGYHDGQKAERIISEAYGKA